MKILFIHEAPGQFAVLHKYLNKSGLAQSWLMCSRSVVDREKNNIPNLVPFTIPPDEEKSYFYIRKLEGRVKRSFYIRQAVLDLLSRQDIDLVVAHGSGGFPLQLFGEVDVPVVTYIEFPSFASHGHDKKYPQPEYARYVDKLFEMSSFHQVIKSELVIVPSEYAKGMFPDYLHHKIVAQMEGFDIKRTAPSYVKEKGIFHIGFTARDLSSAKGFEQFILIAKQILKKTDKVKFVFCGSPKVLYSYEGAALQNIYGVGTKKTFMEHILHREGIILKDNPHFDHVEFSAYGDFSSYIESMDLFLYPLQFGSANWGIFELLFRGRVVVGSNRCFMPEVIKHNQNGLLCDYEDIQGWASAVLDIMGDSERLGRLSSNAVIDANERFSVSKVSNRYLSIFNAAISSWRANCNR